LLVVDINAHYQFTPLLNLCPLIFGNALRLTVLIELGRYDGIILFDIRPLFRNSKGVKKDPGVFTGEFVSVCVSAS
jgi:hypothetical protein